MIDLIVIDGVEYDVAHKVPSEGDLVLTNGGVVKSFDRDYFNGLALVLTKRRWRAEEGQVFWTIEPSMSGRLVPEPRDDNRGAGPNVRHEQGNYHKTEEECEAAIGRALGDV